MPHMYSTRILIIVVLATTFLSTAHAQFYRWVDDDGTIHYSDSLPPSKSQRQQDVMNPQGRVVETIAAPKTKNELEEAQKLAVLEEQRRKDKEQADHRDRVLLAMYLTVEDIEYVRDERLGTVDAAIELTKLRKKKFLTKLQDLDISEQKFKDSGTNTPPWLTKSRKHYKEQLANVNDILSIKEKEKLAIKKRFASEINRYLELKQPELAVQ